MEAKKEELISEKFALDPDYKPITKSNNNPEAEEIDHERYKTINDGLITCAQKMKDAYDILSTIETFTDQHSAAKAMTLSLSFEFLRMVEKRSKIYEKKQLEARRQKDKELTEQDKEIMQYVKMLKEPAKS